MSLITQVKENLLKARKSGTELEKNAYSTLLGEIQLNESRAGTSLKDEKVHQIIRAMIAGNQTTIAALSKSGSNKEAIEIREKENSLYNALLPQSISSAELERLVYKSSNMLVDLANAKNDGQAIGLLVQHVKSLGKFVDGHVVKDFVQNYRNIIEKGKSNV